MRLPSHDLMGDGELEHGVDSGGHSHATGARH